MRRFSILLLAGACAAESPKPAANVEPAKPAEVVMTKAPLKSPKPCLTGETSCGGGVCDLVVKNACEGPVTCDVFVASSCKTNTGFGQAGGKKRVTFAAKTDEKVNLSAFCTEGDVVRTELTEIRCP